MIGESRKNIFFLPLRITLISLLLSHSHLAVAGLECPPQDFDRLIRELNQIKETHCEWTSEAQSALDHVKEMSLEAACPRKELYLIKEQLTRLRIDSALNEASFNCSEAVDRISKAVAILHPKARKSVAPAEGSG